MVPMNGPTAETTVPGQRSAVSADIEADATGTEQADGLPTSRVNYNTSDSSKPQLQTSSPATARSIKQGFSFATPRQAKAGHIKWLKLMGRIGWVAKGIIYALIGGLACDNAVGEKSSVSPQGAFVLIGTANGGRGALVVLALAIITYSIWRFWEGIVGQGYDDTFSKWKNFFKFRLSPIVSGSVYVAYDVLVIEVIPRDNESSQRWLSSDSWPNSWHDSGIGITGLVLVGLGFIAAVIVQLEQFLTRSFHNTIREEYPYMPQRMWKSFRIFVLVTGHIGVLGRAGIFLFAAILFFRTIRAKNDYNETAFGAAFAQLQSSKAGRAALFIMGFFVVLYGLFAVLNVYARIFPTPPPSRVPKAVRQQAANGAAAGGQPPTGFGPDNQPNARAVSNGDLHPGIGIMKPRGFTPMRDALALHSSKNISVRPTAPPHSQQPASGPDVEQGIPAVKASAPHPRQFH